MDELRQGMEITVVSTVEWHPLLLEDWGRRVLSSDEVRVIGDSSTRLIGCSSSRTKHQKAAIGVDKKKKSIVSKDEFRSFISRVVRDLNLITNRKC